MSTTQADLLRTLADGVEGFSTAAEAVRDPELKVLFEGYAAERQKMADELSAYSEVPPEDEKSTITGAVHRGFINLKAAVTSGNDHAILAECERGEDHAVEVFRKAVEENSVQEAASTIDSISARILATHNQIKAIRDSANL